MSRNTVLWGLQVLFGLYFLAIGILHFAVPDGLPGQMEWMYELSDTLHAVSGAAEILGGLGLVLPGLTRIRPELTVWAAVGLAVVMVAAAVWHLGRGEAANIVLNVVIAVLMAYLAYARARQEPLRGRAAA